MVKKTTTAEGGGKKKKGAADVAVNRGAWTAEEDRKLVEYVRLHGDKKWRTLPAKAGLKRCGKSCRLRWLNYLRPGIKRGNISDDEEDLIIRLHNLLGNRWSLIAGRLPGRTDNEIKNHWNTHLSRRCVTINDLNLKHNRKIINEGTGGGHSSCPLVVRTPPLLMEDGGDHWIIAAGTAHAPLQLSPVLDVDQLFDLIPSLQNGDESSGREFGVEAYGDYKGEMVSETITNIVECSVETQAVWEAWGFDELDRLFGGDDDLAFCLLD